MSKAVTGYPTVVGDKRLGVSVHAGPASYTQIGVATPPTGGDSITAVELGLKVIEGILGPSISQDGQYYAVPVFTNTQVNPANPGQTSVQLMWVVAATGAQVAGATNLSAKKVRVTAIGI